MSHVKENVHLSAAKDPVTSLDYDVGGIIVEHAGFGIIHVSGDGFVSIINRKAEELLQVSRSEVKGKRVDMLPLRTPLYKVLGDACDNVPVEISINGLVLSVRGEDLAGVAGVSLGRIIEIRDISEEKREKKQRDEFVAMMTHDLKSPLTVVLGYIHAMKDELGRRVDNSLGNCLGEMEKSSTKLLSMIEDIMDAYRLEVGLLKIERESCDIRSLLAGCCHDGMQEAVIRGSQFRESIPEAMPQLLADPKQLARVFANLIGNALKFTPRRGSIEVLARCTDENLEVEVRDTGIGIPHNEVDRVFNKYFRSSASAGFKGSGLGLTISKAIVEAHGGTITVTSEEGKGSSFTVILPITPP